MELKQRKKINNIPKFNNGIDLSSSVNGIGGDITGIGAYKKQLTSLPTIKEINGMKIGDWKKTKSFSTMSDAQKYLNELLTPVAQKEVYYYESQSNRNFQR